MTSDDHLTEVTNVSRTTIRVSFNRRGLLAYGGSSRWRSSLHRQAQTAACTAVPVAHAAASANSGAKLRLAPRSSTGSLRLGHGRRPLGCCGPAQAWGCDSDAPRPHAHRSRADSQPRPPSRQPEPDCGVAPGWLLLASGLSRLQRDNRRDGPASLHPVFNVHGAVFNVHGADSDGGRGLGLEQTY